MIYKKMFEVPIEVKEKDGRTYRRPAVNFEPHSYNVVEYLESEGKVLIVAFAKSLKDFENYKKIGKEITNDKRIHKFFRNVVRVPKGVDRDKGECIIIDSTESFAKGLMEKDFRKTHLEKLKKLGVV